MALLECGDAPLQFLEPFVEVTVHRTSSYDFPGQNLTEAVQPLAKVDMNTVDFLIQSIDFAIKLGLRCSDSRADFAQQMKGMVLGFGHHSVLGRQYRITDWALYKAPQPR